MFVKVNPDSSLTAPYTFKMLRNDNPQQSFAKDVFTEAAYVPFLESLNVFPVVDNPPAITSEQRLIRGDVVFIDPDYVQQYTITASSSILEFGGTREPTTAELEVNPTLSILYYMLKVQDHVNSVAASFNFGNSSINPRTRQLEFTGDINNIAKYLNRQTGQNGVLARQLETWNDSVWLTLRTIQADWMAGNITAPTWAELLAQLPAAPNV